AHHLHGGGAAGDRRHRSQPAGLDRRAEAAARSAAVPDGQVRPDAGARRAASPARAVPQHHRPGRQGRPRHRDLPARGQVGSLWRDDGGDESPAGRRVPESGAGRTGEGPDAMTALAQDSRGDLLRWIFSAALVLCAHGGLAAAMVQWTDPEEAGDIGGAIVIELAPMPVAPMELPNDMLPGPEQAEARPPA